MPLFGKIVIIKRSMQDGNSFPLVTDTCIIGRDKDCDIRIQFPTISAQHCAIEVRDGNKVYVKQMSNSSLTLLNGVLLKNEKLLKHKDVITIVDRCFRFEYPVGSEHRTSVSPLSSWNSNKTPKSSPLSIPSSAGRTPRPPPIALSRKRTKSPQKSPEKLTPCLPFRCTRKSVSFGPMLSPEQFQDNLPPSTPVKRGRQPSIQGLSAAVNKSKIVQLPSSSTKHPDIEESPQVGLKRKLSPTSVFDPSPLPVNLNSAKKRSRSSSLSPTLLGDSKKTSRKSSLSPLSQSKLILPSESETTNVSLSESLSSEKSVSSDGLSLSSSLSPKSPRMTKRCSSASRKSSGSVGRRNTSSRVRKSSVKTPTRTSKGLASRASFSRKTPGAEKSGRRSSRVEHIPKIVAPDSPDSKKSKALITIHAPQLRSKIKTNKTSIRKPIFSGVLKSQNPPTSARKKKAAKKLLALAIKKRPPIKKRALKMKSALKEKKLERTDPANSPKTKKPSRTPRKSIVETSPIKRQSSLHQQFSSSVNTEVSYFKSPNVTREVFVSPLNTPKNGSVKKSKLVEHYLKDSAATLFDLLSSDSPNVSSDEWLDLTPELIAKDRKRSSKTRLSTKADYTNVSGIRTPFTRKSSVNYKGLKRLLRTPKNSPASDYTNVFGVKELFKTRTTPCSDYENVHGLRNMFRTPQASPKSDYTDVFGMKNLFRETRSTPVADYRDVRGLKNLFRAPRSSPKADYTDVRGVKKLMQLPSSPMGDYTNVSGVKMLMRTPRSPPEIEYDGVKELFVSPSSSLHSGSAKANRSLGSPAKSVPKRSKRVPKKFITPPRKSPQRRTRKKEKSGNSVISPKVETETPEISLEHKDPALPKRGATAKSPEIILPAKRLRGRPKKESPKSPKKEGIISPDVPKPGLISPEASADSNSESKDLVAAVVSRLRRKRGVEIVIKPEVETPEANTVTPPKRGKKVKEVAVEKVSPLPSKVARTRGAAAKKVAVSSLDNVVADVKPAAVKKKTKASKKVASKKKVSKPEVKVTRASIQPKLSPVLELSESADMSSRAATPKLTKARKRGRKVVVSSPMLRPKRNTRQSSKK